MPNYGHGNAMFELWAKALKRPLFIAWLSHESGEEDQGVSDIPRRLLSWPCVSDLLFLKGESWLRAVTLDDSKTPTPVLHN
jgi:hypothetical protein